MHPLPRHRSQQRRYNLGLASTHQGRVTCISGSLQRLFHKGVACPLAPGAVSFSPRRHADAAWGAMLRSGLLDTVPRLAQRWQVLWKRRKQLVKTVLSLACGPGLVKGWKSIAQSWSYRAAELRGLRDGPRCRVMASSERTRSERTC